MAVMGKASIPGRAKTRLVPPLTAEGAAAMNTAFLKDIIANLYEASRETNIVPYVAYGPAGTEPFFREHLPAGVGLIECCFPRFGDCLFGAITTLLNRGYVSACVLNADSPTLPTSFLVTAARELGVPGDRVVMGPSTDGGYYFLGVKRAHRRLFENIEWSTASVAAQTRARSGELCVPLTLLDAWYDVDDATGLRQLCEHFGGSQPTAAGDALPYAAAHTRAALQRLTTALPAAGLMASLGAPVRSMR